MKLVRALLVCSIVVMAAVLWRLAPSSRSAEAVDGTPVVAQRTNQVVRAQGRIIYVAAGQVWVWGDGATHALTKAGIRYEGAAWSPAGDFIVASEVGENHSDLILLDKSGNRLRQLTDNRSDISIQDSAWARKGAWSPDGARIAFVSDLWQTDMSLWSVGARGADPRRLYSLGLGSGGLDWPTWSPDGDQIAFVAYPGGVYQPPQLFVHTFATGATLQITELQNGAFDPSWAPDGSKIAFAGRENGETRIHSVEPDGSALVRLTDGTADRAPSWSPDGAEIAYLSLGGSSFDVWVIRVAGDTVSAPRQLTSGQRADAVSGVSWAP